MKEFGSDNIQVTHKFKKMSTSKDSSMIEDLLGQNISNTLRNNNISNGVHHNNRPSSRTSDQARLSFP